MPRVVASYTILDPTLGQIPNIGIRRVDNGSGGFDTILTAYYKLEADDPSITHVDQLHESISFTLNGAQKSALATLFSVDLDGLNAIKAQENP